jgi:hypothetical protein
MASPAPAAAAPHHNHNHHHVAFAASPPRKTAVPRAVAAASAAAAAAAPSSSSLPRPRFPTSSSDQSLSAEALLPLLDFLDSVRAAEDTAQPAPSYDDERAGLCAEAAAEAAAAALAPARRRLSQRPSVNAEPVQQPNHDASARHGHHSSGGGSVIVVRGGSGDAADAINGDGPRSNGNGANPLAPITTNQQHRRPSSSGTTTAPPSSVAQRWLHLWRHGRGSRHFAPEELRRGLDRLWQASTRGAAVGLTLRGGLHAVGALAGAIASAGGSGGAKTAAAAAAAATARGAPTPAPRRPRRPSLSPYEALVDTLRYGAFLGALAGAMVGADEAIAATVGRRNSAGWRAFLAGVCAGPSLLLTGPQSRHYSLATYVLLRGITLLVRVGNKRADGEEEEEEKRQQGTTAAANHHHQSRRRALRRLLRALLWPTRLRHGDVLLMCLACSQILYAFIMEPSSLPPSYVRFILRQGDKDPRVWAGIRELASRTRAADAAARSSGLSGGAAARSVARAVSSSPLEALQGAPALAAAAEAARQGVVAAAAAAASGGGGSGGPHPHFGGGLLAPLACAFFHPGQSCAQHAVGFVPGAWLRALRVYVPVYLLPMLLVHRGRLLTPGAALPLLKRAAQGVARSSLFLSLAIGLAFGGACCGFHLSGRATGPVIAAWTWPAGLATFVEKKSRRMELALYVAARSLESLSRCLAIWGYLPPLTPTPTQAVGGAAGAAGVAAASSAAATARYLAAASSSSPARARRPPPNLLAPPAAALRALLAASLRRYDVLLFALGCGAIAHCYGGSRGENRDVFRSKYLAVFDFVFGNAGFSAGAVRHEPSNADLIRGAGMRVARSIGRISSMTGLGSGADLAAMAGGRAGGRAGPSRLAPPPASPLPTTRGGAGSSSTSSIGSNSSSGGGGDDDDEGKRQQEASGPAPAPAPPPAAARALSPSFVSATSAGGGAPSASSVATFATASSRDERAG